MNNYQELIARFFNLPVYRIQSIDSSPNGVIRCSLLDNIHHCPFCFNSDFHSKGYYSKTYTIPLQHHQQLQIEAKIKRYKCLRCHKSFSDSLNLTPNHSRTSYATIDGVMNALRKRNETFASVASNFNLSETTVRRYFDKYYHPPKLYLPKVLCFDEVFIPSLNIQSNYLTVMYDFESKKLVEVLPSRLKSHLIQYFSQIPVEHRNNVQYVCIDMYKNYKIITQLYLKKAIICVDSFHVIKNLNDSLDKIRLRLLHQFHSDSIEYYLLKHWKYLLFDRTTDFHNRPEYNRKLKRYINKAQLLDMILRIDPMLEKAYRLVELYFTFNNSFDSQDDKMEELLDIIKEYQQSSIPELKRFSHTLYTWRVEICHSFTRARLELAIECFMFLIRTHGL
ncbi:ISL3 family transposase [Aerococcaceae bacterium zg-ZJ1578]|uniref:ISL3 family transposase n=1 Tax=Aerococcaceae bacterium zg-252 TaxID=2796928 RepID=UPI001A1C06A1|nr:ISL3 family transposase [Aerococcaceae bacterium zg-1578]